MKKFLFTLAALFMAGSAFADSYLYIEPMTITQAQVEAGQRIEVKVKAHFDARVSGFDATIAIPESWTLFNNGQCRKGADMTISYLDSFGDPATVSAGLSGNAYHAIGIFTDPGYEDNAMDSYGVAKWEAGDYENFYSFYIMPTEALESATLTVSTEVTSGADTRGGTVVDNGDAGKVFTKEAVITVEGAAPQPVVAPEPTFDWDENEYVMEATCEGHEVVLMINGEAVANPYAVLQTTEEQTITFTAYTVANDDEDENSANVEQTVVVPARDKDASAKPQFAFDLGDEVATITVTGENISDITVNGTENYTIEGNVVTIPRPAYDENSVFVTVTATNTQTGWYTPTTATSDEYEVAPKAEKVYETKTPEVKVTEGDDAYTLTATCEDEGQVVLVVQYINEDGTLTTERYNEGTVTIARTDKAQYINYWAEATANTPDGYDSVAPASSEVVYYYEIPAKKADEPVYDETCLNPNAAYEITGLELATVTITNREPGATVTYKVFKKNGDVWEEVVELAGEFTGDTYQFDVQGDGTYRVEMIAHLQGKNDSDPGALEFTIHEGETSSVNELANGKTVAGVRYFNMAGQEMQEANGMTIVVTTYTDGTTSAVKVMK